MIKDLELVFDRLGVGYTEDMDAKYRFYMESILERNRHVNLTAITDTEDFIRKHYVDSLLCGMSAEFRNAGRVIDVGTGAGFPGVPLAIAFPEKEFVLMDSLNKRIKIINELCSEAGILNVTAVHGRAEELARRKDMRESFDICVSRAVANMSTLSEYCLPFVRTGGTFIACKGPDSDQEIQDAENAVKLLGGEISRIEKMNTEGFPFDHRLVYVSKVRPTVSKYPRKPGTPAKEPLK